MSDEIKEKEEYEKYARDHRKELDAQEVKLGDVVTVLVGHFAGEKGIVVGIIACDKSDYTDPYYEIALNCEVPEKYKCRKTLVTPNNVAGGFSAHDFEVIGNRAPKQPSNEIKLGDKVRVSKDAPRMYVSGCDHVYLGVDSTVIEIEDGNAVIRLNSGNTNVLFREIAIPTKYLVKVEEEAKEPKFKVGDRVEELVSRKSGRVLGIEGDFVVVGIPYDKEKYYWHIDSVELVEPTEQTEAEKPNVGSIKIPVEVDLTDSYWDAYAADLAKEVALKVANKYNDPEQAAEYAVSVAKAVVEGFKRK